MKALVILHEERHRQHLIKRLQDMKLDPETPLQVVITPYKKNRSLEQNNLYWKLLTEIGHVLGYSKDDMHELMMHEFLPPHIIEKKNGTQIERYSTKGLKVAEMAEYIQQIETLAVEYGIVLDDRREL